jgi:hypothetical protein
MGTAMAMARRAMARQDATTTTMVTGNDENDNGDGASCLCSNSIHPANHTPSTQVPKNLWTTWVVALSGSVTVLAKRPLPSNLSSASLRDHRRAVRATGLPLFFASAHTCEFEPDSAIV